MATSLERRGTTPVQRRLRPVRFPAGKPFPDPYKPDASGFGANDKGKHRGSHFGDGGALAKGEQRLERLEDHGETPLGQRLGSKGRELLLERD